MTEAEPSDLASRYPPRTFPGAAWLRTHPPLGRRPARAIAGWAVALAVAEAVIAMAARAAFGFAFLDVVLVPGGLVAGCWGLAVRRRRRTDAARASVPVDATPTSRLEGAAQQWDLLVHGALLLNLLLLGVLLLVARTGADVGWGAFGPVLLASALIPASVLTTWWTARAATTDGEALALVHGIGRPGAVRRARWLVRIALAPHIVLGALAVLVVIPSLLLV